MKKKSATFMLDIEILKKIEKVSDENGISRSGLVNRFVKLALEKYYKDGTL